jgi:hypothetical protein
MSSVLCAPLMAQQRHVVSPAQMRQAVAAQGRVDQQNRDAVLTVLKRPQAREIAGRLGLTLTQAELAVSALSGDELAGLATSARAADAQLAGGNTIVISTTTLLLLIIIVILLAK